MNKTVKYSGKVHAIATCLDCGKQWYSINSDGLAAQHHYKTGHTVTAEIGIAFTMTKKDSEYHKNRSKP